MKSYSKFGKPGTGKIMLFYRNHSIFCRIIICCYILRLVHSQKPNNNVEYPLVYNIGGVLSSNESEQYFETTISVSKTTISYSKGGGKFIKIQKGCNKISQHRVSIFLVTPRVSSDKLQSLLLLFYSFNTINWFKLPLVSNA